MTDTSPSDARARIVAFVDSDRDLAALCRQRADQLGISIEELEGLAGLSRNHVQKIFSLPPVQNFGPLSRYAVVWGLQLRFALIEDPDAARQCKRRVDRAVRRGRSHASNAKAYALVTQWGREGARKMLENIDPTRLSKLRRAAAKVRWRKWRAAQRAARKNPQLMREVNLPPASPP